MRITTIGRGSIGGTLGKLWTAAGHEVTLLGHEGGDASDADVVLLAPLYGQVPDALAGVTGLDGKIVLDATNRLGGEDPPSGFSSNAEYAKSQTGGPTAKVFNANFGSLLEQAAGLSARPTNVWAGDEETREAVEQLSRDAGFEARNIGPLESAGLQEEFAQVLMGVVDDAGGLVFYRFARPEEF